jgi:hypothetical protein
VMVMALVVMLIGGPRLFLIRPLPLSVGIKCSTKMERITAATASLALGRTQVARKSS